MSNGNGQAKQVGTEGMGTDEILLVLLEAIKQLTESVEVLVEGHGEILEKLGNLNLDAEGFSFIDE